MPVFGIQNIILLKLINQFKIMEYKIHNVNNHNICELISDNIIISNLQDALDILGNSHYLDATKIIVNKNQLCPEFFDLKTKIAGDILQKFSTYDMKLAIIGDFENITSKSLRDFIYESNKNGRILFVKNIDIAIDKLIK